MREDGLNVQRAKHVDNSGTAHVVGTTEGNVSEEAVGVVKKALE